jgi:hypothetical protein
MVTVPTPLCWMIYPHQALQVSHWVVLPNRQALTHLVRSTLGSSSDDGSITVSLQAQGVLADLGPPDVLDGTGSLAVDTLDLVGTDDGVLQAGSALEDEDGVRVTALRSSKKKDRQPGL